MSRKKRLSFPLVLNKDPPQPHRAECDVAVMFNQEKIFGQPSQKLKPNFVGMLLSCFLLREDEEKESS